MTTPEIHRFFELTVESAFIKEPNMSIRELIAHLNAVRFRRRSEAMSYESIFKGSSLPQTATFSCDGFTAGFRGQGSGVDSYFTDVFTGPVF